MLLRFLFLKLLKSLLFPFDYCKPLQKKIFINSLVHFNNFGFEVASLIIGFV